VQHFAIDRVHRPSEARILAGGKGINVARIYRTLGGEAIASGFLGGYNGRFIAQALKEEGITGEFVRTKEESRICVAIVDEAADTQTELNELGPHVSKSEIKAMLTTFRKLLSENTFEFVTFSGSIPPGVPDTIYADLIGIAREAGVRTVLDASGIPLKHGLDARPWMVKPNIFELASLLDGQPSDIDEVAQAARSIAGDGVEVVCVTLGKRGAVCVANGRTWVAIPPVIRFISAVGSGDSFVGAFLWALGKKQNMPSALRLAVGAGTANAAVHGSGYCTGDQIHNMSEGVEIFELPVK